MAIIIFAILGILLTEAAADRRRRARARGRHLRNRRLSFSRRAESGRIFTREGLPDGRVVSVRELAARRELLRQACALAPDVPECAKLMRAE